MHFGMPPDARPDATLDGWKAGFPRSAELFLMLIEELCFNCEHDEALKRQVVNRKSMDELLDQAPFTDSLADIQTAYEDSNTNM